MAKVLGYDLQQLDVLEGGYYPQGFADIELEQAALRRTLIQVFSGNRSLMVSPALPTPPAPFPPPPRAIRRYSMMDGFFRIAFTGTAGSGFGMLVLRNGIIAGADMAGSIYDGTYTENSQTEEIGLQLTMAAPEGVTLVQTGVPLAAPLILPITTTLAQSDIATEKLISLQTSLGPVNVIFKKIRDFP